MRANRLFVKGSEETKVEIDGRKPTKSTGCQGLEGHRGAIMLEKWAVVGYSQSSHRMDEETGNYLPQLFSNCRRLVWGLSLNGCP